MLGALLVIVFFGFVAVLLGFSRWLARRPWAAAGNVAIGVLLFAFAHAYWPAVLHLRTYEAMPANAMVAQVHCERTGPQTYRLTLTWLPRGRMQVYQITGDEWRIDARTLVWRGTAARIGLSPSFRFERLSARFLRTGTPAVTDAAATTMRLPEGYALSGPDEVGDDVWSQARTGQRWAEHVEPGRVYGPWRPLVDGMRYDVWMTHAPDTPDARLDARPAGDAGARAMGYTRPHNDNVRTTQG
ncbi:MAG TPA: hypothetical protein VFI92_03365 [Steroidobacteraceae bacterium]|nr:hypothetical protein [Steroidobacteraceae bacterium]